jgi:hypothetical protein
MPLTFGRQRTQAVLTHRRQALRALARLWASPAGCPGRARLALPGRTLQRVHTERLLVLCMIPQQSCSQSLRQQNLASNLSHKVCSGVPAHLPTLPTLAGVSPRAAFPGSALCLLRRNAQHGTKLLIEVAVVWGPGKVLEEKVSTSEGAHACPGPAIYQVLKCLALSHLIVASPHAPQIHMSTTKVCPAVVATHSAHRCRPPRPAASQRCRHHRRPHARTAPGEKAVM